MVVAEVHTEMVEWFILHSYIRLRIIAYFDPKTFILINVLVDMLQRTETQIFKGGSD